MALFIPDAESSDLSLTSKDGSITVEGHTDNSTIRCKGTLLQVVGSPFTGFAHSFTRGFDVVGGNDEKGRDIESIATVGEIDVVVLRSKTRGKQDGDDEVGRLLESYAARVPAPGVIKRPWIAVRIDAVAWTR